MINSTLFSTTTLSVTMIQIVRHLVFTITLPGSRTILNSSTLFSTGSMKCSRTTTTYTSWQWRKSFNGSRIHVKHLSLRASIHGRRSALSTSTLSPPVGCRTLASWRQRKFPARRWICRLVWDAPTIIHGSTIPLAMASSKLSSQSTSPSQEVKWDEN